MYKRTLKMLFSQKYSHAIIIVNYRSCSALNVLFVNNINDSCNYHVLCMGDPNRHITNLNLYELVGVECFC